MRGLFTLFKTGMFGWDNFKKLVLELIYTLSGKKSLLSSKRIERMLLFNAALGMSCCYVWYHRATIGVPELISICVMLFGYAGFNTAMSMKEKHVEPKDEINKENTENLDETKGLIDERKPA